MEKKPSTWAWVVVHIVYPLLPVPLEGFIRLVAAGWTFDLRTISASTLAISSGLISVFVNQSLRTQQSVLPDPEEDEERNAACILFIGLAIVFFALFALVTLTVAFGEEGHPSAQISSALHGFQSAVFVIWIAPVLVAIRAQRAFKLRASII